MYCGNCFRDNALVTALRRQGHDTLMVPLYLPMTLDEMDTRGIRQLSLGASMFSSPRNCPGIADRPPGCVVGSMRRGS